MTEIHASEKRETVTVAPGAFIDRAWYLGESTWQLNVQNYVADACVISANTLGETMAWAPSPQ